MNRLLKLTAATAVLFAATSPAWSTDARSLALGNAVIANGKGVHGALSNPASMMEMQRREEAFHFRLGFSTELRDTADAIETVSDDENQDLIDDIDEEINTLSQTEIICNPPPPVIVPPLDMDSFSETGDDCVTGTQGLSDLAGRLVDIIDLVDEESISARVQGDMGIAVTSTAVPFAIHLQASATGQSTPDIDEDDRAYIREFETVLDGDSVTLGEIQNSDFLSVDAFGLPLGVQQPEDVLQTESSGHAAARTQLGISTATEIKVADLPVDVGVTFKFSTIRAYSERVVLSEEFEDNAESLADRFKDSEVTKDAITADLGASMPIPDTSFRLAMVARNLIPETIETNTGFKFKTRPQFIVGVAYTRGALTTTADFALNKAKNDNFKTQKMGVGLEYQGSRFFALRTGISHDAARTDDATSLSAGIALGPFEIGGRLTSMKSMESGVQLAFSFQ